MTKNKEIVLVLLITFLYHTMNQMFVPTLPLYISDRGGGEVVVGGIVVSCRLERLWLKPIWEKPPLVAPTFLCLGSVWSPLPWSCFCTNPFSASHS